jgi:hypothetical protein
MLENKNSLVDKKYPTRFAVEDSVLCLPTFAYFPHNSANWISMMDITSQNTIRSLYLRTTSNVSKKDVEIFEVGEIPEPIHVRFQKFPWL